MRIPITGLCCLMLTGCASPDAKDYANRSPALDVREFFNGDLKAVGTYFSPSGKADPQFTIALKGVWHGDDGTLKEHFVYSDGRVQDRMWNLHVTDNHHVTGTAADVDGVAKGLMYGNALNMRYSLHIMEKDGSMGPVLSAEDWILLTSETTGINRIRLSKFGFDAGEMVIAFKKS